MVTPAISVVLAVKNGEHDLSRALRSVLEPAAPPLECLVVNDGSTDGTARVIDQWCGNDPRVRTLALPGVGLARALNEAVAATNGVYVARQDADDESVPGRLAAQYAYLQSHPEVVAVGSSADVLDDDGKQVGRLDVPTGTADVRRGLLTLKTTPVHGSMMIRRSALETVGGYREAFEAGQDYDLWLRLVELGGLANLPEVWYRWRLSRAGVYATRRGRQLQYAGIARMFAWERAAGADDSYAALASCAGDLDAFAAQYRHAAQLRAWWGELLFRGVGNSRQVRRYLRQALAGGAGGPRVAALCAWAHLGLPWPGGPVLSHPASMRGAR